MVTHPQGQAVTYGVGRHDITQKFFRYLSNRFPKGLLKPSPRAPAGAKTAPRPAGRGLASASVTGACSGLPGAGTVLAAAGAQQGQCSEQKTPANRVGLCIGAVRPPHLQHASFI